MKRYCMLLLIINTLFLVGMDSTKLEIKQHTKELIHFLRNQEIRMHAAHGNYKPQTLDQEPSCVWKDYPQGYRHYIPQCLIKNENAIFDGSSISTNANITDPDLFQISNDKRYRATIMLSKHEDLRDRIQLDTYDKNTQTSSDTLWTSSTLSLTRMRFSPLSTHLITSSASITTLQTWDLITHQIHQNLNGHYGIVSTIKFNHSGNKMLTTSFNIQQNTLILWDTQDPADIQRINKITISDARIISATFSPFDDKIFVSSVCGNVTVLDGNTGDMISTHAVNQTLQSCKAQTYTIFTPDNEFCITSTSSDDNTSTTLLWDTHSGKPLTTLAHVPGKVLGVGLTPENNCVMIMFHENHPSLLTFLCSSITDKCLQYLKQKATQAEKIAAYELYCAYKNNISESTLPQSIIDNLPKHPKLRALLEKYFFITSDRNTVIKLHNGNEHSLTPDEIKSSTVLSQKRSLRNKITLKHAKKLGYSKAQYKKLKTSPLFLPHINQDQFDLFQQFSHTDAASWNANFESLNEEQQKKLIYISSKKGLGVARFMAHLCDIIPPQEMIQAHLYPHFNVKKIINKLRTHIITCNARNNVIVKTTKQFYKYKIWSDPLLESFMVIPKEIIKQNKIPKFSGSILNDDIISYPITLNGQEMDCLIDSLRKEPRMKYFITLNQTDELESATNDNLKQSYTIWATDTDYNIINQKIIEYDGEITALAFSPNCHYLVLKTKQDNNQALLFIGLGIQQDASDYYELFLQPNDTTTCYTVYAFNEQSTILAAGIENTNSIILWDTATRNKQAELAHPNNFHNRWTIQNIFFNHTGNRMVTIYSRTHCNDMEIIFWDTTDYCNIQPIRTVAITNDVVLLPHFSSDDKIMVASIRNGDMLFIDGNTGKIISYREKDFDADYYSKMLTSVFSHDNSLLISAELADLQDKTGNTKLWDAGSGKLIATLLDNIAGVCGVGFSPDKRHIITTCNNDDQYSMTTITLFNEKTYDIFKWLKHKTTLPQKYALYCAHQAYKEKTAMPSIVTYAFSDQPDALELLQDYFQHKCL